MALNFCLLPKENLVVEKCPGLKRVEFKPAEIEQAVKAGATLELKGEKVKGATGFGKTHSLPTRFMKITPLGIDTQ